MVFLFPVLASILLSAPIATTTAPLLNAPDTAKPTKGSFLVISDIHLDPSKIQTDIIPAARNTGSDTWDTAQQAITKLLNTTDPTQKPRLIIYLGDLPRHAPIDSIINS